MHFMIVLYTIYVRAFMGTQKKLSSEERFFFSLVSRATLTNPFSDERVAIDREIVGLFPGISREELVSKTISEVRKKMLNLEQEGRASLSQFSGKDRDIMRFAFLFDFFHVFLKPFDQLIVKQVAAGDRPVQVLFAGQALAALHKKGFNQDESLHLFALSYQLRRAYYFIDRGLVGRSAGMKRLRESLWNNVFTYDLDLYSQYLWNRMEDFSTLILGETGTGKGSAANAIGRSGFIPYNESKKAFEQSFTESFISLNLSQYSEGLIESELFGHKKGAFTGAVNDHEGILSRCSPYGSIFLDEIGEVSLPLQIKLLKVLEERSFSPVGSHKEQRFEGRIIAATNRSIETLRRSDTFREDFFYRLCSDIISVPPLWQRIKEDSRELDDLLAYTVERIIGSPSSELTHMVQKRIFAQLGKKYMWPGNVRELAQCVRSILLKRSYKGVEQTMVADSWDELEEEINQGNLDANNLLKRYCRLLYEKFGTYGEVARRTNLDRRTVKKYITLD